MCKCVDSCGSNGNREDQARAMTIDLEGLLFTLGARKAMSVARMLPLQNTSQIQSGGGGLRITNRGSHIISLDRAPGERRETIVKSRMTGSASAAHLRACVESTLSTKVIYRNVTGDVTSARTTGNNRTADTREMYSCQTTRVTPGTDNARLRFRGS